MAKRKKTREQKILAEIKRREGLVKDSNYSYSENSKSSAVRMESVPTTAAPLLQVSTNHYAYLISDLRKTLIVTAGVILSQIVLHNFIK